MLMNGLWSIPVKKAGLRFKGGFVESGSVFGKSLNPVWTSTKIELSEKYPDPNPTQPRSAMKVNDCWFY